MSEIKSIFAQLDLNRDGYLSKEELSKGLTIFLNSNEKALARTEQIFNEIDIDKNNKLDFKEFLIVSHKIDKLTIKRVKNRVNEIYESMDKNADKNMSITEFLNAIGISLESNPVIFTEF